MELESIAVVDHSHESRKCVKQMPVFEVQ